MELVDNAIVRKAVESSAAQPNQATLREVLRSCMFGDLLLDTTGLDAAIGATFPAGSRLQPRRGTGSDGKGACSCLPAPADAVVASTTTKVVQIARRDGYGRLLVNSSGPYVTVSLAEFGA